MRCSTSLIMCSGQPCYMGDPRPVVVGLYDLSDIGDLSGTWEDSEILRSEETSRPTYSVPKRTTQLRHDSAGVECEAARRGRIASAEAPARLRSRRFDHGVFVPLKVAHPDSGIPTVQLSLVAGLDPAEHLAIGRALAPLRDEAAA
jgi:hypothetical protein